MDEKTVDLIKENKGVLRQLTYLNNEVKKLKRSKHQALLNNCVDDDEVILHEREIDCPKDFTEKVMEKINKEVK